MNKSFICLLAILAIAICHPTKYEVDRNSTCWDPKPATIKSWHVHMLYWSNNKDHVNGALQIREKFMNDFKDILGEHCTDLFHQDHLCMFDIESQAVGPFLTAQWAAFIPIEHFHRVSHWAIQNRNGYDVLLHPNSGCELEDHTWWALWSGNAWQIDTTAFSHDQPFPWDDEKSIKSHQKKAIEESSLIRLFNKHFNQN